VFFKRTPQFQPLYQMPVRIATDRDNPYLNSMTLLSSDRLLLADLNNQSVKLVDVVQDKVLYQLKVNDSPSSVCSLPRNRAAVALPNKQIIHILDCDNQLSIVNTIKVQGACLGLDYSNGHLIVLYSFGKIEILNMHGGVVWQNNLEISTRYTYNHLSVMTECNVTSIFVVDYSSSRIHRLDENLQVRQVYPVPNDTEKWSLLAVGENQLLVSDFNGRLWQLDTTMGRWALLTMCPQYAWSLAFCHDRHILYYGGRSGVVKIYAIS